MKKKGVSLTIVLLLILITGMAQAQVTISPTAIFLDPNTKVGNFYVSNPGTSPVEVTMNFEFAYPQTDETGNIFLNYEDEEAETHYSLAPYLRAFPTTFILQPGERQTIRMIGRLPGDIDDGMYWSRVRLSSTAAVADVGATTQEGVAAQITMQIDQVTAAFVYHGSVSTGVDLQQIETIVENNQLITMVDVERTGNSPFIGSSQIRLLDSNNSVVAQRRAATTVYFQNRQRIELPIDEVEPGTYTVELTYDTQRNDIPSQSLLQTQPITQRSTVTIE